MKKTASRQSFFKMIVYGFVVFVFIISLLEIGARILDSQTHFYYQVQQALSWIDLKTKPLKAEKELPWPARALYIRAPEPPDIKQEPYIVGGRLIPGALQKLKKQSISPDKLKRDNRKRIFITGGSAAFGFPYLYPHSFGYQLQNLLGLEDYQVINAAQISFTSGRLVPVVRRIVDYYQPHIIIIFMGNNEWTSWRPYAMPLRMRLTVQTFRTLSESRFLAWILYKVFKQKSAKEKNLLEVNDAFTIQKEIEGYGYALANPFEKFFPYDKGGLMSSRKQFLDTFRENLAQMIDYAKHKNVRVIVMNVPFNHKLSPAFMHPQPICLNPASETRVRQNIDAVLSLIDQKQYDKAYAITEKTLGLEPYIAILHYLKGFILEKMGENLEAEEAYALSRENMIGHLGSRLSINKAIRDVAQGRGAEFVDLKKIFDDYGHARGSFFNRHLIEDDCHPSPAGHRLIAQALYELIIKN